MSLDIEIYEEYRRKLRRASFWRGSFVTLIIILALGSLYFFFDRGISFPHIAQYELKGVIVDNYLRNKELRALAEDENVEAVILRIDSPGGTVVGAEALYESLREVGERKPLVVVMGEIAASGGYIAALAADHIIARENSLTGSIGVIGTYPNFHKLAQNLGISIDTVKSSRAKGGPNPLEPFTTEMKIVENALVESSFTWFKDLVSERRNLDKTELEKVSQGELFTGTMALELGLVDALGGEPEALVYFESLDDKYKNLEVKYWGKDRDDGPFWANFFGITSFSSLISEFYVGAGPVLYSIAR